MEAALRPDTIIDLAEAETLSGDIRDALLTHVRSIKVPWTMLAEDEQQEHIDAIAKTAADAVRRVSGLIAQQGFPHIVVSVGRWTVKEGIKLEIETAALVDNIAKLAEHGKAAAILVLADPSEYIGERAPAKADKDQPDLPMGDDDLNKD
jgi:AmiR/NasT family two-component response regulator